MHLGIVTISYNQADFLAHAIRSVHLKHGNGKLSYILVDPGSTDGSRDIALANEHLLTKIIFEPDQGPADGLNKGFAELQDAEILGYLNSDDYFAPGALDYVIHFFQNHPEIDVLNGAIKLIDCDGNVRLRGRTSDKFNLRNYAMGICTICQQATFFRKRAFERIGGFNTYNRTCWDSELMVDMAIAEYSFSTTYKVLGYFRIHEASITGSQRLKQDYLLDHGRLKRKIAEIKGYQSAAIVENIYQLLYKLNLIRHISYFTVK